MAAAAAPPGYVAIDGGTIHGALLATLERPLRAALTAGTFYKYAEQHPEARPMAGRGIAYAVPLPGCAARVVVRRSRHGGLLAPLTGDLFFGPTLRAPHELAISLELARRGVPTPKVVAYATYPAAAFALRPFARRADVVTEEVPHASDLAILLASPDAERREAALRATAELIHALTQHGVRHPDLNLKNILIAADDDHTLRAYLLDVDRVWFDDPGSARVTAANLRRLARSAEKWRERDGLDIDAARILTLANDGSA